MFRMRLTVCYSNFTKASTCHYGHFGAHFAVKISRRGGVLWRALNSCCNVFPGALMKCYNRWSYCQTLRIAVKYILRDSMALDQNCVILRSSNNIFNFLLYICGIFKKKKFKLTRSVTRTECLNFEICTASAKTLPWIFAQISHRWIISALIRSHPMVIVCAELQNERHDWRWKKCLRSLHRNRPRLSLSREVYHFTWGEEGGGEACCCIDLESNLRQSTLARHSARVVR